MMMGQTRIFYAMSKDGLLPWFGAVHKEHGTPYVATILTGLFVAFCGGVMPMSLVGELVSIGTLLAFVLVCVGVPHPARGQPRRSSGRSRCRAATSGAWIVGITGAAVVPLRDVGPAEGHVAAADHLAGDRPDDLRRLRLAAQPAGESRGNAGAGRASTSRSWRSQSSRSSRRSTSRSRCSGRDSRVIENWKGALSSSF